MIVKELINKGYAFAVMRYESSLKGVKGYANQEWELIGLEEDKELQKKGFLINRNSEIPSNQWNPEGVVTYEMGLEEIREFKTLKDEYFVKVLDAQAGCVWEQKKRSLKDLLK